MGAYDQLAAVALVGTAIILASAYVARVVSLGHARFSRIEHMGESPLLSPRVMAGGLWVLQPLVRACVRLGISANAVTLAAVALSAGASVLLAAGVFGLAAWIVAVANLLDALDGFIARETRTSSLKGAILDSAADRYNEFFLLGGLAVYFRFDLLLQVLALLTLLGSYMVSYSSAKAEIFGVAAPRGMMRRPERIVYLTVGMVLTPLWQQAIADEGVTGRMRFLPLLLGLGLVGAIANVSAVRRLAVIGTLAEEQRRGR